MLALITKRVGFGKSAEGLLKAYRSFLIKKDIKSVSFKREKLKHKTAGVKKADSKSQKKN